MPPALQQDLAQLRRDVAAMGLKLDRAKADTETILGQMDRRSQDRLGEIQRNLADLRLRTDAIAGDIGRVEGRLEEVRHRVDTVSRQLEEARSQSQSGAHASAPVRGTEPAQGLESSRTPGAARATDVYQMAYIDFTRGHFSLAIAGFQEFIKRFPDSDLADNAQYWIGEAHFSMARDLASKGQPATQVYEQAVQEFRKVVINYPRGDKVPTALYKEAVALLELRQQTLAMTRFQYLMEQFPQTEEAALARDRLTTLRAPK